MSLSVKLGIFGAVPLVLLQDENVKPNAIKVYIALSSFAGTNDECFPGLEKIAERSGIKSTTAVSEAIQNLVQNGWVKKTRRGHGLTNKYECLAKLPEANEEGQQEAPKPVKVKTDGQAENVALIERKYLDVYKRIYGKEPLFYDFAKNRAMIKNRLKTMPVDSILEVIESAGNDKWVRSTGFMIGAVLSEGVVNRVRNSIGSVGGVSDAELNGWDK